MAETFFTSDQHFFHYNIIKYCSRPFESVEEMNEVMIERWNAVVKPDDIVYHLGDFSLSTVSAAHGICCRLNGTKYLIRGNHDANAARMMAVGFKEVYKKMIWNGWWLVHRPRSAPDEATNVLHGHTHDKQRRIGAIINVSVEQHNYYPVTLDQLLKVSEGP